MNFDEKPKRAVRQSPIDFVIPLQLEECVYRLKHHRRKESFRFTLLKTNDPDVEKFELTCDLDQKIFGKVKGTLKRWEGTHTRFEGEAQITNPVKSLRRDFAFVVILPLSASLFGILVYAITLVFIPGSWKLVWSNPLSYAFIFAVPAFWLIVRWFHYSNLRALEKMIGDVLLRENKEF